MTENEIRKYLEKFYDGTASEKEENILRQYFEHCDVTEQFAAEKAYFLATSRYGNETEKQPEELKNSLNKLIDKLDRHNLHRRLKIMSWTITTAASVALIASIWISFDKSNTDTTQNDKTEFTDTYKDPKKAYKTAEKELVKFSQIINKGINTIKN